MRTPQIMKPMKTLLITMVTLVVGLIAFPNKAEARHYSSSYTYAIGHASCGCTRYTRRIFNGYDCHGHAIYRYIRVPLRHSCRRYSRPVHSYYYNSYNHYNSCRSYYGRRHYGRRYYGRRSCRPRGSYISFSF